MAVLRRRNLACTSVQTGGMCETCACSRSCGDRYPYISARLTDCCVACSARLLLWGQAALSDNMSLLLLPLRCCSAALLAGAWLRGLEEGAAAAAVSAASVADSSSSWLAAIVHFSWVHLYAALLGTMQLQGADQLVPVPAVATLDPSQGGPALSL